MFSPPQPTAVNSPDNPPVGRKRALGEWFQETTPKFIRWLLFVVVVAFASFAILSLRQWLEGKSPDLSELVSDGEGFLITIAITADALSRAFEARKLHSFQVFACGLMLLVAVTGFVLAASGNQDRLEAIEQRLDNLNDKVILANRQYVEQYFSYGHREMYDVVDNVSKDRGKSLEVDEKIIDAYHNIIKAHRDVIDASNALYDEQQKRQYDPERVAIFSLWLGICGLVSSLSVILLP